MMEIEEGADTNSEIFGRLVDSHRHCDRLPVHCPVDV